MSDINAKVKKIVSEHLSVEESKIEPESRFVDDLGADSLDQVELVMKLEEEFGVEIPDGDAQKLNTVGSAVTYIEERAK